MLPPPFFGGNLEFLCKQVYLWNDVREWFESNFLRVSTQFSKEVFFVPFLATILTFCIHFYLRSFAIRACFQTVLPILSAILNFCVNALTVLKAILKFCFKCKDAFILETVQIDIWLKFWPGGYVCKVVCPYFSNCSPHYLNFCLKHKKHFANHKYQRMSKRGTDFCTDFWPDMALISDI